MNTECKHPRVEFQALNRRKVESCFNGGQIGSEVGSPLLREVSKRTGLLEMFSACFQDHRDLRRIRHTVYQLVSQRIYLDQRIDSRSLLESHLVGSGLGISEA